MMKKFLAMILALVMILSLVACGSSKKDSPATETGNEIALAFVFKNKTGNDLKEAYIYPSGADDKGENILTEVWPNNTEKSQYKRIIIARPEADTYDLAVVDTNGNSTVYPDLALKFMNSVSLKEEGAISLKHDAAVEFTQDDLTAAGLTCGFPEVKVDESKMVTLAFMFKNKSGKDAKEVYIYPTGTTGAEGDNILTEVWPHNMSEDDYKWITIDRPQADVYDVLVNFTDGSSLLFTNEDLRSANSASMKDGEGKLSLKNDPTIGPDGKPVASAMAIGEDVTDVVLRFVFKNKTGLDAKEAYVYSTGAADHGKNVLDGVWVNNEKDADYLHLELERDRANSYEIQVKFTDGTVLTYSDLDLLNNNSVSLRDEVGGCSVKFVEGEPAASAAGDVPETPAETKPAETKPAETKPAETKPAETKPAETKPAETKPAETKPAETKPAETKPAETPAASEKTVSIKFTLKNKEELGPVSSMKFVPSGKSADSYSNALSAPVKGVAVVEATIVAADYYDIVIVFEQGGTKTLKGVPAAFDKISLKNGGASIANDAVGVDYVTSKSGVECNSDKFKFQ